jgi:hypothetical protein
MGKPKYLFILLATNQTRPLSFPHDHSLGFLDAHMAHDLCQLNFPPDAWQKV